MQIPLPLTRDIVLIGGGHTHALVLRRWAMSPLAGARLTLINPAPTAPYSGMLPGHIAGHYQQADLEIDLVKLARFANARLVLGSALGIDLQLQRIQVSGQADISYDIASVDIGITTELPNIPGFAEHAIGAKPLDTYAKAWAVFLEKVTQGNVTPDITIIGGGVAGIELALAMMFRLNMLGTLGANVTVLEAAPTPLSGIGRRAQKTLLRHAAQLGIAIRPNAQVTRIAEDFVYFDDGNKIRSSLCIAAATPQPHHWLGQTGLANAAGFIEVKETLQSCQDPHIYAAGDCAELIFSPRPKAGVFAVREAPILYHNLRAALLGNHPKPFRPQKSYLKLVSTGGKGAVADKAGLRLDGAWLWRWKDRIDRKFMRQFENYPEMPAPILPRETAKGVKEALGDAPLCGGCGAKVAPTELSSVLQNLPAPKRSDIISAPGDDAAVLTHGRGHQVLTTDHLRAFMHDPYRMAKITAIHAMGDIWAMGAKPQAALASIVLPQMSPKLQAETLREIMSAATETFRAAGAEVVGGHTSQGAELTIGFSVTGLALGPVIRNTGAQIGDTLILTKPIGSGTLLAAEMRMLAKGEWMAAAYNSMEQPLDRAAEILAPAAHAMTDVTGFGLAGHLDTMLRGSGLGACLYLADIPVFEGAETLATRGVRSTIWNANRAAVTIDSTVTSATEILLFDPQTAGGLLAALPADKAETCLERLQEIGAPAAIIGEVTANPALKLVSI